MLQGGGLRASPFALWRGKVWSKAKHEGNTMTNCVHDHRHWADKWGEGDQLGAGHLLTPANTLQALKEVQRGEVWWAATE